MPKPLYILTRDFSPSTVDATTNPNLNVQHHPNFKPAGNNSQTPQLHVILLHVIHPAPHLPPLQCTRAAVRNLHSQSQLQKRDTLQPPTYSQSRITNISNPNLPRKQTEAFPENPPVLENPKDFATLLLTLRARLFICIDLAQHAVETFGKI